ncbi:hypothetical protein [Roseateles amylovorans]|uniref:Uncharacterized protein n=1 Tax=Roseateles amylovorans TaxID=2978473 RepID=A0ABY6ASY8_9BURK|nr:hypothetical protein [Roseateles amylovorans]UXH76349.1 hypothetical protein N4261_14900 [Roseateles amylovorans]
MRRCTSPDLHSLNVILGTPASDEGSDDVSDTSSGDCVAPPSYQEALRIPSAEPGQPISFGDVRYVDPSDDPYAPARGGARPVYRGLIDVSPIQARQDLSDLLSQCPQRDGRFALRMLERLAANIALSAPKDIPKVALMLSPPLLEVMSGWLPRGAQATMPQERRQLDILVDHVRLICMLLDANELDADAVLRATCFSTHPQVPPLLMGLAGAVQHEPNLAQAMCDLFEAMDRQRTPQSPFKREVVQCLLNRHEWRIRPPQDSGSGRFGHRDGHGSRHSRESGRGTGNDHSIFYGRLLGPGSLVRDQPGAAMAIRCLDRLGLMPPDLRESFGPVSDAVSAWREARSCVRDMVVEIEEESEPLLDAEAQARRVGEQARRLHQRSWEELRWHDSESPRSEQASDRPPMRTAPRTLPAVQRLRHPQ